MVDEFAPPKFFASVHGMEHDQLFTKFNVGATRQMSLSAEVRMHAEYNIKEKRKLKSIIDKHADLLRFREGDIANLKEKLALKEAEAAKAIRLCDQASRLESVERSLQDEVTSLKERNAILEEEKGVLGVKVTELEASISGKERDITSLNALVTSISSQNDRLDERIKFGSDKVDTLEVDFVLIALHLEENFFPYLLTTIFGRRWLFSQGMKLTVIKCLNSPEYVFMLGAAISKAIENGMQDGLAAGITHGKEGRNLTDVAAYNASTEVDYITSVQQLQSMNFSFLMELKANKDASVETLMNILRLEEALVERVKLSELQPNVDQLMVPVHHSPDNTIIGATALSLALDLSNERVRRIRENIANHISALHDVFVLLAETFSAMVLTSDAGISDTVPADAATTTTLSTLVISTSSVPSITLEDYEVTNADGQGSS
ncbi:hypothetical protein Tco_0755827 [Tanacetum coccineum]